MCEFDAKLLLRLGMYKVVTNSEQQRSQTFRVRGQTSTSDSARPQTFHSLRTQSRAQSTLLEQETRTTTLRKETAALVCSQQLLTPFSRPALPDSVQKGKLLSHSLSDLSPRGLTGQLTLGDTHGVVPLTQTTRMSGQVRSRLPMTRMTRMTRSGRVVPRTPGRRPAAGRQQQAGRGVAWRGVA